MIDYSIGAGARKELPSYVLQNPTIEEMRETAVQCMHDMLTVRWHSESGFTYRKSGAVSGKQFVFEKDYPYAGMPYTNKQGTLFGFLEYCDKETGAIDEAMILSEAAEDVRDSLGQSVNKAIGNTCTGSTGWALSSVCSSLRGNMVSYTLVPKNGFYPVGGYHVPEDIDNLYSDTNTFRILAEAGEEKMFECYAKVLPADLVDQNNEDPSNGHSMMAVEPAVTVYKEEDGKRVIDPDESYIMIQDQRAGFYDATDESGRATKTSGRLSWKATFRYLFDKGYMPITTAEFLGRKAYEAPAVSLKHVGNDAEVGRVTTPEEMQMVYIGSNYALAVLKCTAVLKNGTEILVAHHAFGRESIGDGSAFSCPLVGIGMMLEDAKEALSGATVKVTAIQCNGAVFTPVEIHM